MLKHLIMKLNNFEPPRYTYNDYKNWKEDWELINGYPFQLNPMATPKHSALRGNLIYQSAISLKKNTNTTCEAYHRIDWKINDYTVVRPDFMVVCDIIKSDYLEFPPSLIIEILSPKNIKINRAIKFDLYRENGVKYYLMLDVQKQKIEVFELIDNLYKLVFITKFKLDKTCEIEFNFEDIWK